jgi:hypothetical protein
MVKRLLLIGVLIGLLVSASDALIGVGVLGSSYQFNGSTIWGYGIDIEAPIIPIPLFTSRIEVSYAPGSGYSIMPINLKESFKFPMTPIYVGIGGGAVIYNNSTAGFSAPTALNYNAFVGYEQNFAPLSSWFLQAGYEGMNIGYTIAGTSYTANFSGMSVKGGVRLGI